MLMDAHASERSKWELYYAPFRRDNSTPQFPPAQAKNWVARPFFGWSSVWGLAQGNPKRTTEADFEGPILRDSHIGPLEIDK